MKIGIAEDVALLRAGIAAVLEQHGHSVLWTAADADELRNRLSCNDTGSAVDLLITDVRMPPKDTDDGLRVAVDLRAHRPGVGVLILSQHLGNEYARTLLATAPEAAGGTGYLLKERVGRVSDFLAAVETVGTGGISIDPKVIAHLVNSQTAAGPLSTLTPREKDVLTLMAEGATNEQITSRLHLSAATIERHISSIFTKLGLQGHPGNKRVLAVLEHLRS
jgi:DNA-binding NarL/FixJ family response regulator